MLFRHCTKAQLLAALATANVEYKGNLAFNRLDSMNNRDDRHTVTLKTKNGRAYGSRTSWRGRHGPYASWEAHRDFMLALYALAPDAWIDTMLDSYHGIAEFRAKFPATGRKNVGSIMCPVTMPELSVYP